jgi:hypothetical protein
LAIYHNNVLIASPLRSYGRYQDLLDPEHDRELVQQRRGQGSPGRVARDRKIVFRP